jgi:two-component system, OmpR family, phosphate regulon sensor histidine kinase PhoR
VREPRSIIFYAWAGLAVQAVLVAGVITFVLAGASYQRSAISDLHQKIQVLSVANLTLLSDFIAAQHALGQYQTTGQAGFRHTYQAEKSDFEVALGQVRRLAGTEGADDVIAEAAVQERAAMSAFAAYDRAAAARVGTSAAARLYAGAATSADGFFTQNDRLRRLLVGDSEELTFKSENILGVGLGWTVAVLAVGLMFPVIAVAVGLRYVSGPLHGATTAVRKRAMGDMRARAVPGGPADVRDLARSINFLADESDRVRAAENDRVRLLAEVHQAAIRIRQHLHGQAVVREAVTAIQEHLAVDFVWVGLVGEGRLADGDEEAWRQMGDVVKYLQPESVAWLQEIYQYRSSYRIQNLHAEEAADIPARIRETLIGWGAASLVITPFGVGPELLGCLAVARADPAVPWIPAEVEAVESLAGDTGRGLEHARLYEGEERVIEELKAVDRAKAGFIAAASHDLRTPLTSIIGYVELLSDGGAGLVGPEQAKMLDAVDRNAQRLKTLIEDVLTISKIELGAFTSRLEPADLVGVVWAAVDVIRPSAGAGGLAFETVAPDKGLMVDGDAEQLDRVLVNLLSNAVKYTPRGGNVSLSLAREGDSAVLTVADTGIGIPEKDQDSLFTRFFRASNAVARALPGSGLGLSIVRTIVANHHGEISLASIEGEGTTVTVRLPLLPEALASEQKTTLIRPRRAGSLRS